MANLGIGSIAAHAGKQSGAKRKGNSSWGKRAGCQRGARAAHNAILASGRKLCEEANAERQRKRLNKEGVTAEAVLRRTNAHGGDRDAAIKELLPPKRAPKPIEEETLPQRMERIEDMIRMQFDPPRDSLGIGIKDRRARGTLR